jgi:putative nucleotidyltransferase with HDIG domain
VPKLRKLKGSYFYIKIIMCPQTYKNILYAIEGIPSLPVLAHRLLGSTEQDSFTPQDLENIICQDPAMSARIMKAANSSFFGLPGQVKTLKHAISLLGMKFVQALAVSLPMIDIQNYWREIGWVPWSEFWLHSFACGWASDRLVQRGLYTSIKDGAFLCGLLHDLGKPILWIYEAEAYQEIIRRLQGTIMAETFEVESAVLGIHHGEIGGKLAQHWNFPKEISEAILDHHNIDPRAPGARLIQLADLI